MRWRLRRRVVIGMAICVAICAVAGVSTAAVVAGSGHGHLAVPASPDRPVRHRAPVTMTTSKARRGASVPAITPPEGGLQAQIDTELAADETPGAIAAARAARVPAPAVSTAYPALPGADSADPAGFAIAFATELLDTNYAIQTRDALLAWAEHEEAPNTLPGVPSDVAGKALVLSLADPALPGASPSPVPSKAQWVADAAAGITQQVRNVAAEVDPDWTELVSEGWQPADPRMTIETLTGDLTVTTSGQASVPEPFSLTLTLGSAAHARGYGAVAAGDWTLG